MTNLDSERAALTHAYAEIESDIISIRAAAVGLRLLHENRHAGDDELGEASFFLAQSILDHAKHIEDTLRPDCRAEAAS